VRRARVTVVGIALVAVACGGGGGGGGAHRTTTSTAPTSSTTKPARPPQQVRVLVLNGSGVQGAAARMASKLRALGYAVQGVGNVPRQAQTVVACHAGFVAESAQLANAVGPSTSIVPFPNPPPAGIGTADCLVGLGS
jgi:LytR cell envelope-related transcriptional attenuator